MHACIKMKMKINASIKCFQSVLSSGCCVCACVVCVWGGGEVGGGPTYEESSIGCRQAHQHPTHSNPTHPTRPILERERRDRGASASEDRRLLVYTSAALVN